MNAAVIEGPGKLAVRQLPRPEPGEYQALCELLYGAICSGTDQHLVAGHEPFCRYFTPPAVLGHESIGRVIRTGPKVRNLKPGDLVTRVGTTPVGGVNVAWGGFAQFGIATDWQAMRDDAVPAEQWTRHRVQQVLPPDIDPAPATMIITWRETYSYITRLGARAAQNILIVGSGGNALAFAAHARNLGAASVVMLGNVSRAAAASNVGAQLVDYRAADPVPALRAAAHTGGEYDIIIDSVGKAGCLNVLLPLLKSGGAIGVYGRDDAGNYTLNPILARKSFTFYGGQYDEAEAHHAVLRFMRAGLLDASTFLTNLHEPFALDDITGALESVRSRACVKALVRLTDGQQA